MNDIKLEMLSNVTGGTSRAGLREAIKVIKSVSAKPFDLGGAAYGLSHTSGGFGAMKKPRSWLGGLSADAKIDQLMMTGGMAH